MPILSHCTLLEEEWEWMEHYILEMRLPTLCFWSLEPRKFKRRIKGNAEVDATGRYIPLPWVCRGLYALVHTSRGLLLYQRRGCLFCSVHSTGFPRTLTTNRQRSDTPLSFCRIYTFQSVRVWVFGGHNILMLCLRLHPLINQ